MAEPTYEEMKARLAELERQVATKRTGSLEFRVSEKGGVSVYGLGRFPVTLYFEQWTRLLDQADVAPDDALVDHLHACLEAQGEDCGIVAADRA